MTAEEISLKYSEEFQSNYPRKKYIAEMMLRLRDEIKEYGKQEYNQALKDAADIVRGYDSYGFEKSILELKK